MKKWLRENRGFLVFMLCFGVFRTAVADWNPIPSGSMRPTLLEGDVVLVNRLAYDVKLPLTDIRLLPLAEPARGDVVTFSSPVDDARLIKRLVGLPGDVIEMRDGVLVINCEVARYEPGQEVQEPVAPGRTLPAWRTVEHLAGRSHPVQALPQVMSRRDFGPITVPADHYFMLGDNRDNSADSRYIGPVPRERLIGRAHHLLISADISGNWRPRLERIARRIE